MKHECHSTTLCVHPMSRGFAFTLFEGLSPIDWGVQEIRCTSAVRNAQTLERIETIMDRYQPDTVVVEDVHESNSKRSRRIRKLSRSIAHGAHARDIEFAQIPHDDVLQTFSSVGAETRYEVAQAVAREFPALAHRLPRKRRAWDAEPSVMALFAAAALGVAFFDEKKRA